MSHGRSPAIDRRRLLLAGLALPGTAVARQERDPAGEPSLFSRVIGQPTGRNGYEELVAAADQLRASERFQAIDKPPGSGDVCPLALKRAVLRGPPVVRALELLRRGLAKPIVSQHAPATLGSEYPELGGFRALGRMLRLRQEVALAGGETREALSLARLGIRLGAAAEFDVVIAILVSMAIDIMAVRAVGEHLGELAAADCEELYRIGLDWLQRPDPLPRAVEAARAEARRALDDLRTAARADLEKWFLVSPADAQLSPHIDVEATNQAARTRITAMEQIREAPGGSEAFAIARAWIEDHYDRIAADCRKPPWERSTIDLDGGDSPAVKILRFVNTFAGDYTTQFTRHAAIGHLLACHAAILRYRWEHDRLPGDLETLRLGEIAVDPFTGRILEYELSGASYRLASAGPAHRAFDDLPAGRTPVTLVPEK